MVLKRLFIKSGEYSLLDFGNQMEICQLQMPGFIQSGVFGNLFNESLQNELSTEQSENSTSKGQGNDEIIPASQKSSIIHWRRQISFRREIYNQSSLLIGRTDW